jgi:hypothetical protein
MSTTTALFVIASLIGFQAGALPPPPAHLPEYQLHVAVDDAGRSARATQTVLWTNTGTKPTDRLVLYVHARHRPDPRQRVLFERTLESLRMDSREAFDREGRRLNIIQVKSSQGNPLEFHFDEEHDTHLTVKLPTPVAPGDTCRITLEWTLDIPCFQGRIGRWNGITTLLNWIPILAVYEDDCWKAVHWVPWHLSFYNEAARYRLTLELPAHQHVATGGTIVSREALPKNRQRLFIAGDGLRDLAVVFSDRFQVVESQWNGIRLRILAFPEHRAAAEFMLQSVRESLTIFGEWFGPYPFPEFTLVESYFGWNGNQSSGMVLIDERVFRTPTIGRRYVDHLVTHEICHQWWYGLVGVDGYHEMWLSEAFASYYTKLRIKHKYGKDAEILTLPHALGWLPNIEYDTLTNSGYYIYHGRGGKGTTESSLPDIGHLHNLFFLVYDRGGKILGMIHHRIGDEVFIAFSARIVRQYAYRNLRIKDYQRELELETKHSWSEFFDHWLRSPHNCDWAITDVDAREKSGIWSTNIRIRQEAEIAEPVELVIRTGKGTVLQTARLEPDQGIHESNGVTFRQIGPKTWQATLSGTEPPDQVELDPDHRLLDVNLGNNSWNKPRFIRFTPLFTPLDEASLLRPLDEPSFRFGPGIDIDGRLGIRGALLQGTRYRVSPFLAYQQRRGTVSLGLDSEFFNALAPNVSVGARYERTLSTSIDDLPEDQGRVFVRWYQAYTSSMIYPHLAYLEGYFRFGDNFFPVFENIRRPTQPGVLDFRDIHALGVNYHVDTRFPYWNPEKGLAWDTLGELGIRVGGSDEYQRIFSQLSAVRRLPDELGPLSELRLAGRIAGGYGSPDNGLHFRFGGPLGFRGQRSEDTKGNAYWLASTELRFPLLARIEQPIADNIMTWKSLHAAVFYDVGEVWIVRQSYGIDHAIGIGIYFDLGVLSFVERFGVRLELGHSLTRNTDVLWFGLHRAF